MIYCLNLQRDEIKRDFKIESCILMAQEGQAPVLHSTSAWESFVRSFLDANLDNISKLVQVSKLGDFCKHDGDFYNMV